MSLLREGDRGSQEKGFTLQLRSNDDLETSRLISQLWPDRFLYFLILLTISALKLVNSDAKLLLFERSGSSRLELPGT